jgi:hypothetical protein
MKRKIQLILVLAISLCFSTYIQAGCNPNAYFNHNRTGNIINLSPSFTGSNTYVRWFIDGQDYFNNYINSAASTQVLLGEGFHDICMELYDSNYVYCTTYCNDDMYAGDSVCQSLSATFTHSFYFNDVYFFGTGGGATEYWSYKPYASNANGWFSSVGTTYISNSSYFNFTFPANDTFVVFHKVTQGGCQDSSAIVIITGASQNCGGANASFNDSVSGNRIYATSTSTNVAAGVLYNWYLDNQLVNSGYNATNYVSPVLSNGNHVVYLRILSNEFLCDSILDTVYVSPVCNPNANASFTYTTTSGSISSVSNSTGVGGSPYYRWYRNGTLVTQGFTATSANFTGLAAGTYNICLKLYTGPASNNLVLCDSFCQSITLGSCNAVASFTYDVDGSSINVTSTSTGVTGATFYQWKRNGTLVAQGNIPNYTLTGLTTGNNSICLLLYNGAPTSNNFCDSICYTVNVGLSCGPVTLSAITNNDTIVASETSAWDNSSTYFRWYINGILYSQGYDAGFLVAGGLASGQYNLCLYTYTGLTANTLSLCDSLCQLVTITNGITCPPNINASFTYTTPDVDSITVFSNSTGVVAGTYYKWYVNGQLHTQGNNPTTVGFGNLAPGTYNICLELWTSANNGLLCDSFCQNITVGNIPCDTNATFTVSYFTWGGNTSNNVTATPTGVSPNLHLRWLVDGNDYFFSYMSNNAVTFLLAEGNHNICMQVYDASYQLCHTECMNVYAGDSTCFNQSAAFATSLSGNTYTFTPSVASSGGADYWTYDIWNAQAYNWWWFGYSGTTVSADTLHVVFPTIDTFQVCHYTFAGTCADSACVLIIPSVAVGCDSAAASFTYTINANNTVSAVSTSTGVNLGTTYKWYVDFQLISSGYNLQGFNSAVLGAGFHTISLELWNGNQRCDSAGYWITISTGCNANTNANFSYSTTSNSISALSTSSGTNSTTYYKWYRNGSLAIQGYNASNHTFGSLLPGTYNICLQLWNGPTVNNLTLCDTICQVITIAANPCNGDFTTNMLSCNTFKFDTINIQGTSLVWDFGDGNTSNIAEPTHTYATAGNFQVILTINGINGCQDTASYFVYSGLCDTLCGRVFNDLDADGIQDAGENGIAGRPIYVNGTVMGFTNAQGNYTIAVVPGTYTVRHCPPAGYAATLPNYSGFFNQNCPQYINVVLGANQTQCGLNFGIRNNQTSICGLVYIDANNNNTFDNNENIVPYATVHLVSSGGTTYNATTSVNGTYCYTLPSGTYTITVQLPAAYVGASAAPAAINLTANAGQSYANNNFAVHLGSSVGNLCVSVSPSATISPGMYASYYIYVSNLGSQPMFGTVQMFYDPLLVFQYSSPVQLSHDAVNKILTFNLTTLLPGAQRSYYVRFNTPVSAVLNTPVFTEVNVLADASLIENELACNTDTLHQLVLSSWDPNNKVVDPVGAGTNGGILGDGPLHYTINFQNTGNAPAVNVILTDVIDEDLDISTLQMQAASHDYNMTFDDSRMVIWQFANIMLPDSFNNEPESHGFVSYTIYPLTGLDDGTQITNEANIYFDFNAPVLTNTTLNTIDYKLNLEEMDDNVTITLMPNPFSTYTNIMLEGVTRSDVVLYVYDLTGKRVIEQKASGNIITIMRNNLSAGMYLYQVQQAGKLLGKGKMVAE